MICVPTLDVQMFQTTDVAIIMIQKLLIISSDHDHEANGEDFLTSIQAFINDQTHAPANPYH